MYRYMGAGEFDTLITLKSATTTTNSHGEQITTYSTLDEHLAKVVFQDGDSQVTEEKDTIVREVEVFMHYRSDITASTQVEIDSITYTIKSIVPIYRNRYIKLICEDRD
jgi:SPP1 family predicted phage head-tail adaptor